MENWEDNIKEKVDSEYEINHKEELEQILESSTLYSHQKESIIEINKHIITAEILLENNPLATEADYQYLKYTKAKYQQVKEELL